MRRSTIVNLLLIILAVVILLTLLQQLAEMPNRHRNGFTRTWLAGKMHALHEREVQTPLQKICGATLSHLFFTVPNPQGVIVMDTGLYRQDTLLYGLLLTPQKTGANNTFVDSPDIYFFANNIPALFRGKLNDPKTDSINLGASTFTRSAWMSPNRILLRVLSNDGQKQVFEKIDSRTGQVITEADIIPRQGLGGFESDGLLQYDRSTHRLFYILYYQNLFYCLDTSLHLLYTGHTIDTTRTNSVSVKRVKFNETTRLMPATPRVNINQECCTGGGYLFIVSGLKADNELEDDFRNNEVVDRYRIDNGHYAGSFYIPHTNGESVRSIFIRGHLLVALYKGHVRTFRLDGADSEGGGS